MKIRREFGSGYHYIISILKDNQFQLRNCQQFLFWNRLGIHDPYSRYVHCGKNEWLRLYHNDIDVWCMCMKDKESIDFKFLKSSTTLGRLKMRIMYDDLQISLYFKEGFSKNF